ncbi:hypothetical protein UCDDA912_g01502 [Diaporthe ampelina]|uniref:BZIP domain-containing protein n=1 Tax=Diaporthe ampelina TaxID=1214573 RepID=A0A0G2IF32_9PEZI|nr:hypothetical protein UCDDA912_g01502 [Diaporthe ampelina]
MYPRQIKPDPEVEGQGSPDLLAIQPVPGNTASPGTNPASVIHETGDSYFRSQFPGFEATPPGLNSDLFLYPDVSGIASIPTGSLNPFIFGTLYSPRGNAMNNMSRNTLPSSGNARSQSGAGTGAGITKRQSRQPRQGASAASQAIARAARGAAVNPGQAANQPQGFDIDLTGMDYPAGGPSTMGLYGSALGSGMDPGSFASSSYNPHPGASGGAQQNPQRQDYRNMSPAPKFDPDLCTSPDLTLPGQYESFAEEEHETKPDPGRIRDEGAPHPARSHRASLARAAGSPTAANTNGPANGPPEGAGQAAGGGRQAATSNKPPRHLTHVPPNRIAEAGPLTHPDPEWRPYGVNHWHVFLTEPATLKYLSSTEIKDIREHCYELAKKAAAGPGGGGGGGEEEEEEEEGPQPVAEGSPYTTADAQAVWRHCDAYVRRRSQVRNNQAARRSRQRKDAETRYWKAKALEYGAPDHEFNWDLVEESPPAAEGTAGQARAARNNRGQQGQAQAAQQKQQQQQQQQQEEGQGRRGRGGGRQGQAAAGRAPAASAAEPEFDFNQPLDYDEDDKTHGGGFDAFTGGF